MKLIFKTCLSSYSAKLDSSGNLVPNKELHVESFQSILNNVAITIELIQKEGKVPPLYLCFDLKTQSFMIFEDDTVICDSSDGPGKAYTKKRLTQFFDSKLGFDVSVEMGVGLGPVAKKGRKRKEFHTLEFVAQIMNFLIDDNDDGNAAGAGIPLRPSGDGSSSGEEIALAEEIALGNKGFWPEESASDDESSLGGEEEDSNNNNQGPAKYQHLWVQCENCYKLNYKRLFMSKFYICEYCGHYVKMNSSDRIDLPIDLDTWDPMDEDMILNPMAFDSENKDPFEFCSENKDTFEEERFEEERFEEERFEEAAEAKKNIPSEMKLPPEIDFDFDFELGLTSEAEEGEEEKPFKEYIDSYQRETGLTDAIQTGIGRLNGIPVAMGVMDFEFIGGSMGCVVGEKITRLIEYATKEFLPLILVCASGGARMQEGCLSLMQMAKISAALYEYQSKKKLFYVSILTSPTTGGVTASFGMLGDIIIAEPKAYIAFAGKRVIEELFHTTVPEGAQETEHLFDKGLLDSIVPRNELKAVLSKLLKLHSFLPLNLNSESKSKSEELAFVW
uniref:Acetyl-coenzyme A carboxylase carboxyl transferase subunit beta n=1 Tax=Physena sessiliflora TaxID=2518637 RepID=A0A411JV27_9CARY|nr:acetyl-CoA carboxylase carboxyltransferase beta subunit [Physena sessiliflora]QBC68948.1 acetyl-CoA carboxylase carboxyltransferase beta subunit [Physena sessiliflora]